MADGGIHIQEPTRAPAPREAGYVATRARVEEYFDRTATRTWERLTSDAPVSGIRATVRAGRDRMRALLLAQLPEDLTGLRILDAGCGTGALAVELAERGAEVVAIDISPALVEIARKRCPEGLRDRIAFASGDMLNLELGTFDHVVAMDSLIYYDTETLARLLDGLIARVRTSVVFTLAPRTPLLMAMWRVGKLFPRSDRSPAMVPQASARVAERLTAGRLREIERVSAKFYISTALEITPC